MISKKASTIAYIFAAIGFFDFSLTESGRAGHSKLQFQYKGKYVELYQSDYLQLLMIMVSLINHFLFLY